MYDQVSSSFTFVKLRANGLFKLLVKLAHWFVVIWAASVTRGLFLYWNSKVLFKHGGILECSIILEHLETLLKSKGNEIYGILKVI